MITDPERLAEIKDSFTEIRQRHQYGVVEDSDLTTLEAYMTDLSRAVGETAKELLTQITDYRRSFVVIQD